MAHQTRTQQSNKSVKRSNPQIRRRANRAVSQEDRATVQHLLAHAGSPKPREILALQRMTGNRATTHYVQAKLRVGPVGDRYEREADRVADQVLTMPESPVRRPVQRQGEEEEVQAKPAAPTITPMVQRQEEEELQMAPALQRQEEEEELQMAPALQRQEEEEELQMAPALQRQEEEEELQAKFVPAEFLQRQAEEEELQMKSRGDGGFAVDAGTENHLKSLRGSGKPLSKELRSFMEPRFGADFGGVRVHKGGAAAQLNRDLNAKAFTHGQDIYFRPGTYQPETDAGKRLIAHELTHVIQQTGAVQRAPKAPAYVDEDFRQKIAERRRSMGYEEEDEGEEDEVSDTSQHDVDAAQRPFTAYEGEHLEEKKEAAARLASVLHPKAPPPLPPRPRKAAPPPLPPRPWQAGNVPGQAPRGSFLSQGRRAQPGWQAGQTPSRGAPRGNFLGTRQTAPTTKMNIVLTKAHTRLVKRTLEGEPAQRVKLVEKSKKHKLYRRFDLVEIEENDSAHIKNDAGEVVWYQIRGQSNEYIRASSVMSTAPEQPEMTGPDTGVGVGENFWAGMGLVESATATTDDRLVDRIRGLTAEQEKLEGQGKDLSASKETELTRLTYAEGAVWTTAGILGMATSLKTVLSDESSRWEKVEAAFTYLSSSSAVIGGTTQIASKIAESKAGEESTGAQLTSGMSAFSLSFQEFFSTLADLVKTTKSGVDLIHMVFDSHKHGKNDLLQAGSSVLLNALSTLKGAAKTARAINETLGGGVTSAFSQAASTIAVGIDIAISAIKTVMQSYYLAKSAYQWWNMSRREGELKSDLKAQGYVEKQIKDVKDIHARRDAMQAELDQLIAKNERKIAGKNKRIKRLSGRTKPTTKRQSQIDNLKTEIEALRQQNDAYKQKKGKVEQETAKQESSAISASEERLSDAGPSQTLDLAEVELVGELRYVNKKRVLRQSVHIITNLAQIAGSIATLVSGPGAPAPLALKASAAGIDLSLPFFRAIKQFGRNTAAKNRAKGTSGISNKIFNADKSTAAKLQMRKRQAVRILTMVTQLNDLIPTTQDPKEYTRQVDALKAQAERVESYIVATGCDPEKLYRANGKPAEQIKILVEELARREFL